MRKIKPFEDLTFHDDFMFGLVMQDKNSVLSGNHGHGSPSEG